MTPEVCKVKIEELEEIQEDIAQRIKDLKEEAGFGSNFYETLSEIKENARRLMQDRVDEEDDQSIWDLVETLHDLFVEAMNYLKPKQAAYMKNEKAGH